MMAAADSGNINDYLHAEMFEGYATFSSGARHDPHACRGIERMCFPSFEALNLARLPWDSTAAGGRGVLKQDFEVLPRTWSWMFSLISCD